MPNVLIPIYRPLSSYRNSRLYKTKPAGRGGSQPRHIARSSPNCFVNHPRLQIVVVLVGKRHLSGVGHFLLVLLEELGVDLHLRGSESGSGNEFLEWMLAHIKIKYE